MKTKLIFKKFKKLFFLGIFIFTFTYQNQSKVIYAVSMDNYQNSMVTEELRLKVPSNIKNQWLEAEESIWEPWLSSQDGFLGRQIFWNREKEEALILLNWKSKKLWKSISIEEVKNVQEKFEDIVKVSLNINENPFKLIYEGELEKQE